jgi:hypothetical protein
VARWRRREALAAWETALREAGENRVPGDEEFEALQEAPPEQGTPIPRLYRTKDDWRQEAQCIGLSDPEIEASWAWYERNAGRTVLEPLPESVRRVLTRNNRVEDDWRRDARAAGLSAQEREESWAWYARRSSGAPPVLEEAERVLPDTIPDSVRRVLTRNIRYVFLADDPFVDNLLDAFKQPIPAIPDDLQGAAEDWQFWDDVGYAFSDPSSDADARRALDRLARRIRLKPEHTRRLARQNDAPMEATKRRLVHEAVVLSLAAADERIRIGRRKGKDEPAHPITLEHIFGREGLQDILTELLRNNLGRGNQDSAKDIRGELERSLGGPFRPAHLADRAVYRNWLTKEIQRQTGVLLGEDLDIRDADRLGGSRRQDISYDETDPSGADGESEDQERARPRTADHYTEPWGVEDRAEEEAEASLRFQRLAEQVWREHEAPVLRQYIACVREESWLLDDDAAAAVKLHWPEWKVRDVKRRFKLHLAQVAAEQRWKAQFRKGL